MPLFLSGYAAFSQRLCRFFSAVMPLFSSGYAAFSSKQLIPRFLF
jgi:hypothetical protein